MTLNQLIDNILLIARNNNIAESEHLSRAQIEKWIIGYRAMLIKQDIDKDRDINDMYLTTIEPIHLDREETVPGIIQIGSRTKAKLQKYRKATCKDYIAWVKNNRIYVDGDSNQLEYISVDVIAEDPTELNACFDPDSEFPIPSAMIPVITQMIMQRELSVMITMPSDDSNDAHDDTQNRVNNK